MGGITSGGELTCGRYRLDLDADAVVFVGWRSLRRPLGAIIVWDDVW
jgi:hypothetical protein